MIGGSMNSREMLLNLLDRYILEDKTRRNKYNNNEVMIDLYDEVLNILSGNYQDIKDNSLYISILFDTIYRNNIYYDEFYSLLLKCQVDSDARREFKRFIWKINNEKELLEQENANIKKQIDNNKHLVSSANRVKLCFRYDDPISEGKINDMWAIKRIISYYELGGVISNKEELLLINEIELHNRKVAVDSFGNKRDSEYTEELYEKIPNILQGGFQEHDEIQVLGSRKGTLDKFVKEIINTIKDISNDEIQYVIESYRKYKIDDNEYNYIINEIMNSYVDDLLVFYQYLLERDVYNSRNERNQVIKEYYMTLDRYLWIRSYYEKINEDKDDNEVINVDDLECKEDAKEEEKILVYSRSLVNPMKAYLIEDMSDMSYEDYQAVYELINKFRDGSILIGRKKKLSDHRSTSNAIELVHDQVRVVIKHVKENIYCLMGVFTKKATNKRISYDKLRSRMIPDISTKELFDKEKELDSYNDKQLDDLVTTKARKGTR